MSEFYFSTRLIRCYIIHHVIGDYGCNVPNKLFRQEIEGVSIRHIYIANADLCNGGLGNRSHTDHRHNIFQNTHDKSQIKHRRLYDHGFIMGIQCRSMNERVYLASEKCIAHQNDYKAMINTSVFGTLRIGHHLKPGDSRGTGCT